MRHVRQAPQNGKLLEWSQRCQRPASQASHYRRTKKGHPRPADNRLHCRTKKLITPRLRFGEKVDARAYSTEDPPTTYVDDTTIECNGTPTEDWLRRQALASIKRPYPQTEHEKTYTHDKDYRDNPKQHANLPTNSPLINRELSATNQLEQNESAPDDRPLSQQNEGDNHDSTKTFLFPDDYPTSLNSIKEYVAEKDGETYIPLHSTIVLKSRRRMLYLPLEFGEITMDGLVDSGAFINAMSSSDYNAIKMNSDSCVIKEYPQPPFKIECANAQLEQPIATADIQFNIGAYTFTDTFVILSKTSFPIIG